MPGYKAVARPHATSRPATEAALGDAKLKDFSALHGR